MSASPNILAAVANVVFGLFAVAVGYPLVGVLFVAWGVWVGGGELARK